MLVHVLRDETLHKEVNICLVGKYTSLEDSYISVTKALKHAALYCKHKLNLKVTDDLNLLHFLYKLACRAVKIGVCVVNGMSP